MRNILLALLCAGTLCLTVQQAQATAIVGLIDDDGTIYIGSDSAVITGQASSILKDPKVFLKDKRFVIGTSGSPRTRQVVRYACDIPEQESVQTVMEYMVVTFMKTIQKCFEEAKFDEEKNGKGNMLVGYRGRLFKIYVGIYYALEYDVPYTIIGSGGEEARGAMYATEGMNLSPEERIKKALGAAAYFDTDVRSPFHVLRLPTADK